MKAGTIMKQASMGRGMTYDAGTHIVELDVVVNVARDAGKAIMEIYSQSTTSWEIQTKSKDGVESPLTKADQAANDIICKALLDLYPSIPIISEENRNAPFEIRQHYSHFWCIDPIDGTKEFIKKNGQFTVNIGLCQGPNPVLGVVCVPGASQPKTYCAIAGKGAYCEMDEPGSQRRQIFSKTFSESDAGLTIVASASHGSGETEAFIRKYSRPSRISLGSSLKLLLVAEGSAHVYPRLAPTCEWDTCASDAIVRASGGEVLQHGGPSDGQPLVYNKPDPLNPFFVVYGRRIIAPTSSSSSALSKHLPKIRNVLGGALIAAAVAGIISFLQKRRR